MNSESMLIGAVGAMAAVIGSLAAAIGVLWRKQDAASKRCEEERIACEDEQKKLWAALVDATGRSVAQLQNAPPLKVDTISPKNKPPSSGGGSQFAPLTE